MFLDASSYSQLGDIEPGSWLDEGTDFDSRAREQHEHADVGVIGRDIAASVKANLALDDSDNGALRRQALEESLGEKLNDEDWDKVWEMHSLGGHGKINLRQKLKIAVEHWKTKPQGEREEWEKIYKHALREGFAGSLWQRILGKRGQPKEAAVERKNPEKISIWEDKGNGRRRVSVDWEVIKRNPDGTLLVRKEVLVGEGDQYTEPEYESVEKLVDPEQVAVQLELKSKNVSVGDKVFYIDDFGQSYSDSLWTVEKIEAKSGLITLKDENGNLYAGVPSKYLLPQSATKKDFASLSPEEVLALSADELLAYTEETGDEDSTKEKRETKYAMSAVEQIVEGLKVEENFFDTQVGSHYPIKILELAREANGFMFKLKKTLNNLRAVETEDLLHYQKVMLKLSKTVEAQVATLKELGESSYAAELQEYVFREMNGVNALLFNEVRRRGESPFVVYDKDFSYPTRPFDEGESV